MEFYAQDLLYLRNAAENAILEVSLSYKDFKVEEKILRRLPFPNREHSLLTSLCLVSPNLF